MNIETKPYLPLRPTDPDEAVLLGAIEVFGTPYHFMFVEVVQKDGELVAVNDPHGRLDDINLLYDAAFVPTVIEGKLYVGVAHPYGD